MPSLHLNSTAADRGQKVNFIGIGDRLQQPECTDRMPDRDHQSRSQLIAITKPLPYPGIPRVECFKYFGNGRAGDIHRLVLIGQRADFSR